MGHRGRAFGRDVHGILLLDKATGMSSNFALQRVKRLFGANKAGHTGALDPLATGMLPICLGEATKFSQLLLDSDKAYEVTARLGQKTTTSDSEGEIVLERPVNVTKEQITDALAAFRGNILQVPSMYSALKHNGKPLYEYARAGISVERQARPITVYSNELVDLGADTVSLSIACSKGTYIRTIIDDLGEALGCGAHVIVLNRTKVAAYPKERMVTLEQLENISAECLNKSCSPFEELDKLLLPVESAVQNLPKAVVPKCDLVRILNGQSVRDTAGLSGQVSMFAESGAFIGVGESVDGMLIPCRLMRTDSSFGLHSV